MYTTLYMYMDSTEMSYPVYQEEAPLPLNNINIRPAQLGCLGGSVGRVSA